MSETIYIGTQPNPKDRLILTISEADYDRLPSGDETVTVTDLHTRKQYALRRADCGLNCRCALELAS